LTPKDSERTNRRKEAFIRRDLTNGASRRPSIRTKGETFSIRGGVDGEKENWLARRDHPTKGARFLSKRGRERELNTAVKKPRGPKKEFLNKRI